MRQLSFACSAIGLFLLLLLPNAADAQRDGPFHQDPGDGCYGYPDDPFCQDSGEINLPICTDFAYYGSCAQCYYGWEDGGQCLGCRTPLVPGSYPDRCTLGQNTCVESGAYCVIAST